MKKEYRSLSVKLSISIALILFIIFFAIALIINLIVTNNEVEDYETRLQTEVSISIDLIEQLLDIESNDVKQLKDGKIVELISTHNNIELTKYITNKFSSSNYLESIIVFSPSFETIASTSNKKINMKEIAIFQEIISTNLYPKVFKQPIKSIISDSVIFPVIDKVLTLDGTYYLYSELSLTKICEKNFGSRIFGHEGYLTLNDEKGIVLFHKDRGLVLISLANLDFMQKMINSANESGVIEYVFKGEKNILAYKKFNSWTIFGTVTEPQKNALKQVKTYSSSIMISLAISLIIMILSAIIFSNKVIIKNFIKLIEPIQQLTKGDLRASFPVSTKDEIGYIAKQLNNLLERLNLLIKNVKDKAKSLNEVSLNLASNMEETAAAIYEINKNIESSKNQIDDQVASVTQTSAAVEELTRSIDNLNQTIEDQAANITESSSAIEQMVSNIASVASNAENTKQNTEELLEISNSGKKSLDDVFITIKEISRMSENLIATTSLIMSIADKTNLLAMNAAIEAAHAGEFGKGFAVVADEIRKLSEQTASQSKSISQNLNQIKNAIDKVADTSKDTSDVFNTILQKIASVDKMAEDIKISMDEQKEGSKQILEALKKMNQITSSVKNSSSEMKAGNNEILSAIKKLNQISYNVKNSNEEIFTALNEINKAATNVSKLANITKSEVKSLNDASDRFTIKEDLLTDNMNNTKIQNEKFESLPQNISLENEEKGIQKIED